MQELGLKRAETTKEKLLAKAEHLRREEQSDISVEVGRWGDCCCEHCGWEMPKKARYRSCVRNRHLRMHGVDTAPNKWKMPPEVLKAAKKGKHTVMSDRARLYRIVSPPWACKPTLAKTWAEVEQGGHFKKNLFALRCLDCQREVPQFTLLLKTMYCPAKKDQWPEVSTSLIHLGGREVLGIQAHG